MNFKDLSLTAKIAVGCGVPLVLLLVLGGISYNGMSGLLESAQLVDHGHVAVEQSKDLEKVILQMQLGQKGYLISGKEAMLALYKEGEQVVGERIAELKGLVAERPNQIALLDEIATLADRWRTEAAEPEILARERIDMSAEERRERAKTEGDSGMVKVEEVLDPATLRQYQKLFGSVTGLSNMVAEHDGSPVRMQSLNEFSTFCFGLVRQSQKGAVACQKEDAKGGRVSGETGKPYAYECHAGLVDFAVPIMVDGRQIGSWLGGQVLTKKPDDARYRKLAKELNIDPDAMVKAVHEIPVLSKVKVEQSMEFLSLLAQTMSKLGNNLRLWQILTDRVESGVGDGIMNEMREKLDLFITAEIDQVKTVQAQAEARTTSTKVLILACALVALVIGCAVSVFIVRSITGPIAKAMTLAEDLSRGDFSKRLNLKQADEVGQLSESLDRMAEMLGQNDATLKANLKNLNDVLAQVDSISLSMDHSSHTLSDSGQSLSQAATEAASSLEEISAALTQIGAQTKDTVENAGMANTLSATSLEVATAGKEQMDDMLNAMGAIHDSSQNIVKITKVIDEIAFQTNLLSLNAAVEAARAGQHGKGFAVVAEEVRNLAVRSAKAAHEISDLILNSVGKVENGNRLAGETSEALVKIVDATAKTAAIVKEISDAASEQAAGIDQISQGLSQVDGATQMVTATSEESAATSEELAGMATNLRTIIEKQRGNMDGDTSQTAAIDSVQNKQRLLPPA
ncbi:methyl-accepting chemotaxis sensory transducer, class 36H, CHASE3 and Hist_Kin_Sens domain-containing [Syntrophotalea carbinolica DSM 2380]|uniref:Methyl-accepting chemotaxis sensory transducer, class 36H, CHASE3 and Hist_Kin_Sens domain-containing n=1 Tax=Syntrophotalea carbinolica (strain DSM 2380 / NBRC 103641 / GraBd1) TaxID=338963 RepID=Q3A1B2_SYNC1|nr:methyl-accepting chemotaxis protein [Syntrophotalea carbinolica]ABA89845.1 methyl-accepting chemotaxis sensory transducer, class 36H, CHASE3 and Hist_Kin_Sens domain-containing [Syntrophotalea carbinolica DSM 2380]